MPSEALLALRTDSISIGDLPKYPEVRRDLALLVDLAIDYVTLERLAYDSRLLDEWTDHELDDRRGHAFAQPIERPRGGAATVRCQGLNA